jgi:hypothetical protein
VHGYESIAYIAYRCCDDDTVVLEPIASQFRRMTSLAKASRRILDVPLFEKEAERIVT